MEDNKSKISKLSKEYIIDNIYDKHWYAIIPSFSLSVIAYLYNYCITENMHFSLIKHFLLENNINNMIIEDDTAENFKESKLNFFKENNMTYPTNFDEYIDMFEKFKIFKVENDKIILNDKLENLEKIYPNLDSEIVEDILVYDRSKSNYTLLVKYCKEQELKNLDKEKELYINLINFKNDFKLSEEDIEYIIFYGLEILEKKAFKKTTPGDYIVNATILLK